MSNIFGTAKDLTPNLFFGGLSRGVTTAPADPATQGGP